MKIRFGTGPGLRPAFLAAVLLARVPLLQSQDKAVTVESSPPERLVGVPPDDGRQSAAGRFELQRRNPRYRLQVGDQLEVQFSLTPEYSQTATVQPDGFINLRGVEDTHVAGMTTPEVVKTLKEVYAPLLNNPEVTVVITNFEKPFFIAAGEFASPGKFELRGTTTLLAAVAMAGGVKDGGKPSQLVIFRRASNDWIEVRKVNLKKIANSQRWGEELQIMPGDLLYVPRSLFGRIDKYIPRSSLGLYLPTGVGM